MPKFASFGKAAWLLITSYNLHKFSFVMVYSQIEWGKKKLSSDFRLIGKSMQARGLSIAPIISHWS